MGGEMKVKGDQFSNQALWGEFKIDIRDV